MSVGKLPFSRSNVLWFVSAKAGTLIWTMQLWEAFKQTLYSGGS